MSKFLNKLSAFFATTISFAFACLSIWILIANITSFFGSFNKSKMLSAFSILLVLATFAFIFVFWKKIKAGLRTIGNGIEKISVKKMFLIIILTSLITKIVSVFVFKIDSSLHPDITMYWSYIQQLAQKGTVTEHASYALRYVYTLIFSTFFLPVAKVVGTNSILIFNVYLSVLLTISAILVFDLVKYYKGKKIAFVSSMLWVLYPLGIVEPLLLVHENSFVFFHSLVIWLWFRLIPSTKKKYVKIIIFIISVVIILYATMINAFGLFSICSYLLITVIKVFKNKIKLVSVLTAVFLILALPLSYVAAKNIRINYVNSVVDASNYDISAKEKALSYGWTIYVGLNYESKGSWSLEDRDMYFTYETMDKEEALEYQKNLIKDRVQFYLDNPVRIIIHINDKMESIWTNSFNPVNYDYGGSVNKFLVEWKGGIIHSTSIRIIGFLNVIFAFVLAFSIRKKDKNNKKDYILYMMAFSIALTMVLMLTEVTPKYSSHIMFIYFILLVNGFNAFVHNMDGICNKFRFRKMHNKIEEE